VSHATSLCSDAESAISTPNPGTIR